MYPSTLASRGSRQSDVVLFLRWLAALRAIALLCSFYLNTNFGSAYVTLLAQFHYTGLDSGQSALWPTVLFLVLSVVRCCAGLVCRLGLLVPSVLVRDRSSHMCPPTLCQPCQLRLPQVVHCMKPTGSSHYHAWYGSNLGARALPAPKYHSIQILMSGLNLVSEPHPALTHCFDPDAVTSTASDNTTRRYQE